MSDQSSAGLTHEEIQEKHDAEARELGFSVHYRGGAVPGDVTVFVAPPMGVDAETLSYFYRYNPVTNRYVLVESH